MVNAYVPLGHQYVIRVLRIVYERITYRLGINICVI